MKLQQNNNGTYFIYLPTATIRELGLLKGDNVSIQLRKTRIENVDSRELQ